MDWLSVYKKACRCFDNGYTPEEMFARDNITDPHIRQAIRQQYEKIVAAWDRAAQLQARLGPDKDINH